MGAVPMIYALAAVSIYAVTMTLLWRSSAASVRKLMEHLMDARK